MVANAFRASVFIAGVFVLAGFSGAQTLSTSQMVNVGGRGMRVVTAGFEHRRPGQPVLILEAGAGNGLDEWRSIAQSLHDLLSVMTIAPPYVLVGHSMGGAYIRGFSTVYPEGVAGYVYSESVGFDVTPEEKASAVPASQRAEILAPIVFPPIPADTPAGLLAEIALVKSEMVNDWPEARKLSQKAGVPVAVIMAAPPGRLEGIGLALMRLAIRHQAEWALQSSNGLLIVSGDTKHVVQKDAPELVLQAVRHVLANIPASSGDAR